MLLIWHVKYVFFAVFWGAVAAVSFVLLLQTLCGWGGRQGQKPAGATMSPSGGNVEWPSSITTHYKTMISKPVAHEDYLGEPVMPSSLDLFHIQSPKTMGIF